MRSCESEQAAESVFAACSRAVAEHISSILFYGQYAGSTVLLPRAMDSRKVSRRHGI